MLKALVVLLTVLLNLSIARAQSAALAAECKKFLLQVKQEGIAETRTFEVPRDANSKMDILYWIRKGKDPSKPPVLLIHGGVGGNSWRYYSTFKGVAYDGDIVSIDNRNEGCSNVEFPFLNPSEYSAFRSRRVVEDLEVLRKKLYGPKSQWRVFGQSRGVSIAHQYLEMFPEAIESLQTHGFAALTDTGAHDYTFNRSHFNARGSARFAAMYPEAAKVLQEVREILSKTKICIPMNFLQFGFPEAQQPKVCGAVITDSISYKLSAYNKWSVISSDLMTLRQPDGSLDHSKILPMFKKEIDGNIYVGFFNYILGTNGLDTGSASPQTFARIAQDPDLKQALISEGRFVAEAVYPAYLAMGYPPFVSGGDPIDFVKVRKWLEEYEKKNGQKFSLTLFSSFYDTIAAPELYEDEARLLKGFVTIHPLNQSGHEGWATEPDVTRHLFR